MPQGLNVTLTTTPAAVAGSGIHGVITVTVRNRGAGSVYLGGADVTTNGFTMTTADNAEKFTVLPGETLYGTSTGSISVQVLRMGETSSS